MFEKAKTKQDTKIDTSTGSASKEKINMDPCELSFKRLARCSTIAKQCAKQPTLKHTVKTFSFKIYAMLHTILVLSVTCNRSLFR